MRDLEGLCAMDSPSDVEGTDWDFWKIVEEVFQIFVQWPLLEVSVWKDGRIGVPVDVCGHWGRLERKFSAASFEGKQA